MYLVGFFALFTLWYFSSLPRNYFLARKTGLPIIICPVNPVNIFWLVVSVPLEPTFARYLPSFIYEQLKVGIYGWEFRFRYTVNAKLGPAFVVVTPARNEVWIADPEMAYTVLMRRNDFPQLEISTKIFSIFGANLSSSNGSEWQRHRKIVAPVFNERIMNSVWDESSTQARDMLEAIFKTPAKPKANLAVERESNGIVDGVRTIALNVFGFIVYGDRQSFAHSSTEAEAPPGYQLTFMESIFSILNNHFISIFVPAHILTISWMPRSIQKMGIATAEFPKHTKDFITKERNSPSTQNTLLSVMVKTADNERHQSAKPGRLASYLSEDEITGNLFNFTLAGFDTTSNTMAYALITLAIEPKWQDWIAEEIDRVARLHPDASYDNTFPLLTRCLALMYETLRIYTPALHIPRCTAAPQTSPVFIPAKTTVHLALACMHVSPTLYGPDPLAFRPTRWIAAPSPESASETLINPPRGTFMPFSSGPRSCPGSKMAQVEFVGVIREIFASWRVEAAQKPGETAAMARERLEKVVENSQPKITLQVKNPRGVLLKWVRR